MRSLIVTIIAILFIYGVDVFLRRVAGRGKRTQRAGKPVHDAPEPEYIFTSETPDEKNQGVSSEKIAANVPNKPNISSCESLEAISKNQFSKNNNTVRVDTQVADLKNDNRSILTFDADEIRKGFIYSEIFHRKYK